MLSNYVPKSSIIPLNLPYVLETFSKYPFTGRTKMCRLKSHSIPTTLRDKFLLE